jgi:hypothetical protein
MRRAVLLVALLLLAGVFAQVPKAETEALDQEIAALRAEVEKLRQEDSSLTQATKNLPRFSEDGEETTDEEEVEVEAAAAEAELEVDMASEEETSDLAELESMNFQQVDSAPNTRENEKVASRLRNVIARIKDKVAEIKKHEASAVKAAAKSSDAGSLADKQQNLLARISAELAKKQAELASVNGKLAAAKQQQHDILAKLKADIEKSKVALTEQSKHKQAARESSEAAAKARVELALLRAELAQAKASQVREAINNMFKVSSTQPSAPVLKSAVAPVYGPGHRDGEESGSESYREAFWRRIAERAVGANFEPFYQKPAPARRLLASTKKAAPAPSYVTPRYLPKPVKKTAAKKAKAPAKKRESFVVQHYVDTKAAVTPQYLENTKPVIVSGPDQPRRVQAQVVPRRLLDRFSFAQVDAESEMTEEMISQIASEILAAEQAQQQTQAEAATSSQAEAEAVEDIHAIRGPDAVEAEEISEAEVKKHIDAAKAAQKAAKAKKFEVVKCRKGDKKCFEKVIKQKLAELKKKEAKRAKLKPVTVLRPQAPKLKAAPAPARWVQPELKSEEKVVPEIRDFGKAKKGPVFDDLPSGWVIARKRTN